MKILVTGACGYIGSHTVLDLLESGHEVVAVDNLSNSSADVLKSIELISGKSCKLYPIDLCDEKATEALFDENPDIKGVIHFAALKAVGESVEQPIKYFKNNNNSLLNVLVGMQKHNIPYLIFSSSCTVYGDADLLPVTEMTPLKNASSPYGRTKQMGEQIIEDCLIAMPKLQAVLLRYFNPAGAHQSGLMGESPINPPQNLVPVITETAIGKRNKFTVFGDEYATRDGSCLRDYIHVMDLARAHVQAIDFIANATDVRLEVFNLGIGEGVTVLEAINAFESVNEMKLNYEIGSPRPGDIPAIYADIHKANAVLKWTPTRDIIEIMRSAWEWEKRRSLPS